MMQALVYTRRALLLISLLICSCALDLHQVTAEEIPWRSDHYSVTAERQSVVQLILNFAADQAISVDIDPAIESMVSGLYEGTPQKVLESITLSNGLVWYFDGVKLYIYPSSAVTTQIYPLGNLNPDTLVQTLKRIGIYTERYPIRVVPEHDLMFVPGPPRYQQLIELMLNKIAQVKLEQSERTLSTLVFRLNNAWADDQIISLRDTQTILPGLATILRNLVNAQGAQQNYVPGGNYFVSPRSLPGLRGSGLNRYGGGIGPLNLPESVVVNGLGSTAAYGNAPVIENNTIENGGQPVDAAANAALYSQASIQADRRLNAVIIRDIPERLPEYEKLLRELDVPAGLIEIEATIVDIDQDALLDLGPPWSTTWRFGGAEHNAALSVVPGDLANVAFTLLRDDQIEFGLRLQALQEDGHAEIVSKPTVLTLNNVEAQLDSTRTFFVRVAGLEQADLFDVNVGTNMRVTPHIVEDTHGQRIKLIVHVEDGTRDQQDEAVDGIPQVIESTVNTQAVLNPEESLLIGGLTRSETRARQRGIPVLRDIPKVGFLFANTQNIERKTQRFILLKPKIVDIGPNLVEGDPDFNDATRMSPHCADPYPGTHVPLRTSRGCIHRDISHPTLPGQSALIESNTCDQLAPTNSMPGTAEILAPGNAIQSSTLQLPGMQDSTTGAAMNQPGAAMNQPGAAMNQPGAASGQPGAAIKPTAVLPGNVSPDAMMPGVIMPGTTSSNRAGENTASPHIGMPVGIDPASIDPRRLLPETLAPGETLVPGSTTVEDAILDSYSPPRQTPAPPTQLPPNEVFQQHGQATHSNRQQQPPNTTQPNEAQPPPPVKPQWLPQQQRLPQQHVPPQHQTPQQRAMQPQQALQQPSMKLPPNTREQQLPANMNQPRSQTNPHVNLPFGGQQDRVKPQARIQPPAMTQPSATSQAPATAQPPATGPSKPNQFRYAPTDQPMPAYLRYPEPSKPSQPSDKGSAAKPHGMKEQLPPQNEILLPPQPKQESSVPQTKTNPYHRVPPVVTNLVPPQRLAPVPRRISNQPPPQARRINASSDNPRSTSAP